MMTRKSVPGKSGKPIKTEMNKCARFKLTLSARNELNKLVNKLLQVTSDASCVPPNKSWELHVTIDDLLNKIMVQEKELEVNPPCRSPEAFLRFKDWMKAHEAEIDKVEIAEFTDFQGYGLKAKQPIKEKEQILTIPRQIMLTSDLIKTSLLKKVWEVDPLCHNMPNVSLALLLLVHRLDRNSFWYPYINCLPPVYDTVMYFSLDELQQLKGSPVFDKALKQCRNIARQYAYFYSLFQNSTDQNLGFLKEYFTYDIYRWAVSTVMTRQNAIPGEEGVDVSVHALIPYWDMANHTHAQMTTDYSVENKRCECFAFKAFNAGDQVLISYGKRPNSELLLHNGFVYPDNPEDELKVRLGVSQSDPLYGAKCHLLEKLTLPPNSEYIIRPGPEPFTPYLLTFLKVFNMSQEAFDEWEEKTKVIDAKTEIPQDEKSSDKAWIFFEQRIKLLLAAYPTTKDKDEEMLKTEEMSSPKKLAVLLRLSEKRILQNALEHIQNRPPPPQIKDDS